MIPPPDDLDPSLQLGLLELTHDSILVRDAEDRILFWNAGAEQRYGWARAEAVGKVIHDLLQTRFPEPLDAIQACLQSEGFWEGELVHRRRDGTEVVVTSRWVRECPQGEGSPLIFEFNNDITPRKRAQEALRKSRESLQLAAETLGILTWEWSNDDKGLLCRSADSFLADFPGVETELAPTDLLEQVVPSDQARVKAAVERALSGHLAHAEFQLRDRSGCLRWFALDARGLAGTTPGSIRLTGILREVTEFRRFEQQLQEAQKLEAIGRLAGGIAHDFNNLLTAIMGYAELLSYQLPPESPCAGVATHIKTATERGANLTRQLLGYARKQVITPRILDANQALLASRNLLEQALGEHITLEVIPSLNACSFLMDPGQLDQVLLNLVINARDAMPDGGTVTLEVMEAILDEDYCSQYPEVIPGEYLQIAVSDSGLGMSPDVVQHAFEPFFTTKGVGKGTGLGLATCFGIVKQNHGHIWVYSEPGQGTTFKLLFPRVAAEEDSAPEPGQGRQEYLGGSETILLVEDDPDVRTMASLTLSAQGFLVIEAGCGEEAVQAAVNHAGLIHLVVSDVVMPGLKVTEMVRRLHQARPGLKVLFMSGYTENAIVHQGVLDPGICLLTKPFSQRALLEAVRRRLDATQG